MKSKKLRILILAAVCTALGVLLPSLFHTVGAGPVFLPMHIPVLIAGFVCGPIFGGVCGLLVPFLSSIFTGMPPLFPIGIAMIFELGTYGLVCGLLYKKFGVIVSLLTGMLAGRVVSGIVSAIVYGVAAKEYGLSIFLTGAFVKSLPGILIQLIAIPIIIKALEKAGYTTKRI